MKDMARRMMVMVFAGCLLIGGCKSAKSMESSVGPNACVSDGELVLVKDGKSQAPIVLIKDAPPFLREATETLVAYIEKTSGAKPEVLEGTPDPLPKHAIWVGYQPVLEKLLPKVDFDFKHAEEILIAANADHLVIVGRDVWDPEHLVVPGDRNKPINGKQSEYGTINAVYTFLQDCLGVRWFWPGEWGDDVIERETISFNPFVYRYHPQMRARGGIFNFSCLGNLGYGRSHEWTRKQRLQLGSLDMPGGHAFSRWWGRFHEDHPEYFALQPDGTRSGYPSPRTVKMCHSNPEVADVWLQCVGEKLERNPHRNVFNASPNDGWASGHCVCDNCLSWDHPDGKTRRYHWQGFGQEHVAMSDRDVTFANAVARKLKERYPDKDYYVLMMSYGNSRPAPIEAVPDDNVIISSVANFFQRKPDLMDRGSVDGETFRQQFEDWGKIAPHIMWRPNTGSPGGWQQGLPDVPIGKTIADMRFAADNNSIGMFIDSVWEHWATQGPIYYVLAQMGWNPYVDGHAVLKDYCQRAFGPAADLLEEYWTMMEDARNEHVNDGVPYADIYDEDFFEKAYGLLDEANAKLADAPEKYRHRLRFVRAGLDHTKWFNQNRELVKRLKESEGNDKEAADKLLENWKKIKKNCAEFPYAINWGPVRPSGKRTRAYSTAEMAEELKPNKKRGKKAKRKPKKEVKKSEVKDLDLD